MATGASASIAVVHGVLRAAGSEELIAAADDEVLAAVQREALVAIELLEEVASGVSDPSESVAAPMAVEAVGALTMRCVEAASEIGLSLEAAAMLACEGLAALVPLLAPSGGEACEPRTVIAQVVLEAVCKAIDGFTLDVFISLRRLNELLQPRWDLQGHPQGGVLVFGAAEAGQPCAAEIKLFHTLQGVCLWTLALVARIAGYQQFTARCLWEFASVSHDCVVFAQGALSFVPELLGAESDVRTPDNLVELKDVILASLLDLPSPDVEVYNWPSSYVDDNVSIEERHSMLMCHHALLAAASAENGVLDCLLAYPWHLSASRLAGFASFLAALAKSASAPEVGELAIPWVEHCLARGSDIWHILTANTEASKAFLKDCAAFAHAVPPSSEVGYTLVQRCLVDECGVLRESFADDHALAGLVALAANAGCTPGHCALSASLASLPAERRASLASRLNTWRDPVRLEALGLWLEYMTAQDSVAVEERREVDHTVALGKKASSQSAEVFGLGLRELIRDAPPEFCCNLDGMLLTDPVRSPLGHVFERSVLVRALASNSGLCPLTAQSLTIDQCHRDKALRMKILSWVRVTRPKRRVP